MDDEYRRVEENKPNRTVFLEDEDSESTNSDSDGKEVIGNTKKVIIGKPLNNLHLANGQPPTEAGRVVSEWKQKLQRVWEQCQPEADIDHYLAEDDERDYYKRFLIAFYKKYNPEGIERIDSILEKFTGHYDAMLVRLYEKYGLNLEELPTQGARELAFQDDSN